jgi:type VI protein secretion system component Hcp
VSGSGGGTSDSLNFDFTGFAHSHQEFDAKGGPGPVTSVGWDFINAQPASVPAHAADAAAAKLADSLPVDSPLSYFMTYDGAPGWLQVSSFDTGMSGGSGQATAEDAVLTLGSSSQLVQLTGMLLSGKELKGVEVEAYRMDGAQPKLVDEYKFQDVTLTGLDTANVSANALTFNYVQYAEGHIAYDAKGSPSTITTGGWDFGNNTAFSGGTPVADAISKQLTGGVAPGTDLDYYIRFDTAGVLNSWLKLGAFSESFAAGADGGKVSAFDVMGLLGSNSAMPNLVEALGSGTHLSGVEIEAYSQGTTQLIDQYYFSDAALTGLQVNGSAGFTADSVSFDFGGFAHSHQELDAKGAPGAVSSVAWDFANAQPETAPAHTADAVAGTLADALPMDTPLSYFVTYDGAPGWLPVSWFSTGMNGGTGQASADDVMLALGSSKQLVDLTQALLSGKQLNSVEVEAYRMDGAQPQLVDEYKFEDVILNGLSTDGSATQNTLSFSYAKYGEGHIAYDANGAPSTITTGGWDFAHNTVFDGGTPHADIDFTS